MPAEMESYLRAYWPLLIYGAIVALTGGFLLSAPYLLGPRRQLPKKLAEMSGNSRERFPPGLTEKAAPYECGVPLLGGSRERFSVRFYLVAILFVLFDIETIFLVPWAVIYRKLGFYGVAEMLVFVAFLFLGFLYAWKRGGLDWE